MNVGQSPEEVFTAEFASLYTFFARRLGPSMAEELTAETFAIAYRRWSDLDPSRPVRPWLYGIAANLLKHHWRKERRMLRAYARTGVDPLIGEADLPPEPVDVEAMRPALASALAELRYQEREILLLSAWADLSDGEIAESLGVPLGTVKSRLSRARQHMRNRLRPIGQVEVETPAAE
jgi:RNA polymerase sigma factor (sigma-70 family)